MTVNVSVTISFNTEDEAAAQTYVDDLPLVEGAHVTATVTTNITQGVVKDGAVEPVALEPPA